MKDGLAVLADWYAKGLIDEQFATRTAAGATDALFTGGQAGAAFVPWWYCYTIPDLPRNDPEAEVVMVNAPIASDGNYYMSWPDPATSDFLMVRKDYEYPEAVVKVMNCEFDMWRGLDPEGWDLVEPNRDAGVDWGYMFPTSGVNLEFANCVPEAGVICKNYIEEGKMECNEPVYAEIPGTQNYALYTKEFLDTGSFEGVAWTEYTGRYRASSPDLMYADNVVKVEPVFGFVTESMADLKPNLDTLEQTTFLKIVMGELPVDAFDDFVEQWYAQGGQTMIDEVKAAVGE
jgi:putative aldouronate transport system substrate-binding protein